MPLWKIFHPPSTFTDPETKSSLSKTITKLYSSSGLPAFYVVVLFIPVDPENMYVGGVSRPSPNDDKTKPGPDSSKPFIRVTIEHVARKMPDHEAQKLFIWAVDRVLKPHIADKGYDWEVSRKKINFALLKAVVFVLDFRS